MIRKELSIVEEVSDPLLNESECTNNESGNYQSLNQAFIESSSSSEFEFSQNSNLAVFGSESSGKGICNLNEMSAKGNEFGFDENNFPNWTKHKFTNRNSYKQGLKPKKDYARLANILEENEHFESSLTFQVEKQRIEIKYLESKNNLKDQQIEFLKRQIRSSKVIMEKELEKRTEEAEKWYRETGEKGFELYDDKCKESEYEKEEYLELLSRQKSKLTQVESKIRTQVQENKAKDNQIHSLKQKLRRTNRQLAEAKSNKQRKTMIQPRNKFPISSANKDFPTRQLFSVRPKISNRHSSQEENSRNKVFLRKTEEFYNFLTNQRNSSSPNYDSVRVNENSDQILARIKALRK